MTAELRNNQNQKRGDTQMWSRTVETAVKLGFAVNRGSAVAIVTDDGDREIYVILGNTVTEFQFGMSDSNGAWIPATTGNYTGVQFLQSGVAGDVVKARAAQFKLP